MIAGMLRFQKKHQNVLINKIEIEPGIFIPKNAEIVSLNKIARFKGVGEWDD